MNTAEKLKEYLHGDENRLVIETNAQLLALKEIVEELYCTAKNITPDSFREVFQGLLDKNRKYLFERELKVLNELEDKEQQED